MKRIAIVGVVVLAMIAESARATQITMKVERIERQRIAAKYADMIEDARSEIAAGGLTDERRAALEQRIARATEKGEAERGYILLGFAQDGFSVALWLDESAQSAKVKVGDFVNAIKPLRDGEIVLYDPLNRFRNRSPEFADYTRHFVPREWKITDKPNGWVERDDDPTADALPWDAGNADAAQIVATCALADHGYRDNLYRLDFTNHTGTPYGDVTVWCSLSCETLEGKQLGPFHIRRDLDEGKWVAAVTIKTPVADKLDTDSMTITVHRIESR